MSRLGFQEKMLWAQLLGIVAVVLLTRGITSSILVLDITTSMRCSCLGLPVWFGAVDCTAPIGERSGDQAGSLHSVDRHEGGKYATPWLGDRC